MLKVYVAHYPEPIVLQPTELSCETYTCRLRDAVNALERNPTWNNQLQEDLFNPAKTIWRATIVSHDGTNVRIGPKVDKAQKAADYILANEPKASAPSQNENQLTLTNYPNVAIDHAAGLVNCLNEPIQIRFVNGWQHLGWLTPRTNVEAVQDGDDLILL